MSFISISCSLIHVVHFIRFYLRIKGWEKENFDFIAFGELDEICLSLNLILKTICIRIMNHDQIKWQHVGSTFSHRHNKRLRFTVNRNNRSCIRPLMRIIPSSRTAAQ